MRWVAKDESLKETLQQLLKHVRLLVVSIHFVLLDREFYSVNVIRYLQASQTPFLMPVAHRGRKPADPRTSRGTRRFLSWKKSSFSKHTLQNAEGRRATIRICVCCRNYAGRRKRHGRKRLVYAFWGFQPGPPAWVCEEYRKRYDIETSYRQMNQCRIRTCTRNPVLRLLFVGIALFVAKRLDLVSLARSVRPPPQWPLDIKTGTAPPDDADAETASCRRTPARRPRRPASRNTSMATTYDRTTMRCITWNY